MNDTRNKRYTKRKRTIHANKTNEKRKRYEISVNLNDPGSVPNTDHLQKIEDHDRDCT
jgi:hypothetical protein